MTNDFFQLVQRVKLIGSLVKTDIFIAVKIPEK